MSYYVYKKGEMDLYVHFISPLVCCISFMHLADAFIQSDLQCIQAIHFFCQYVCSLGIEPTTFCAADSTVPQEHHNIWHHITD